MSSTPGSLFGDIIEWFLGKAAGDRRQYKRRTGVFHVWYQRDPADPTTREPGVGLEISPNGIVFLVQERVAGKEFTVAARLREREVRMRVKILRQDTMQHQGSTWFRYAGEFGGVAADDWDAIVRYVNDEPDDARHAPQRQHSDPKVDDAYRLLPSALQEKIIAMLVAQNKLEEPRPGQAPLLKLFYGGAVTRPGQSSAHRFNVHSRVKRGESMLAFDTRFIISEDGEITVL